MSLRLIQVLAAKGEEDKLIKFMEERQIEAIHTFVVGEDKVLVRGLLRPEEVEGAIEALDPMLDGSIERVLVTGVEATVPEVELKKPEEQKKENSAISIGKFVRISKEELKGDIEHSADLNLNFVLLIVLASIVAGIGILKDNLAVVIGAMVIAPFLGPNVALAFGTIIGDVVLVRKSIETAVVGTLVAVGISVVWGLADAGVSDIPASTVVEYRDIVLALTCGFAGVLSMMTGQATSLVGVMVAAALLPPLMRAGLFLGGGLWMPSVQAMLLFVINVTCVLLAGIVTFYLSGIRPQHWWEKKSAKKHTRRALLILSLILILLVVSVFLLRRASEGF